MVVINQFVTGTSALFLKQGYRSLVMLLLIFVSQTVFSAPTPNTPGSTLSLCTTVDGQTTCNDRTAVKWEPGHYINSGYFEGASRIKKIYGSQHFKGAKVDVNWADLETAKGVYDFSMLEPILAEMTINKKYMFLYVRHKTFNRHAISGGCAPKYIHDAGAVGLVYYPDGRLRKCIAYIWRPVVINAFSNLMTALGAKFNDHPYFGGVIFEETSVGALEQEPSDFTADNMLNGIKSILLASRTAFPNSQVIQWANWIRGGRDYMKLLFDYAQNIGVGIGGPDLMPQKVSHAGELYPAYAGKLPLAIDNQWGGEIKYFIRDGGTVEGAYYYAVEDPKGLLTNYIFWAAQAEADSTWDFATDIKPVIDAKKGKINGGCPGNIDCWD